MTDSLPILKISFVATLADLLIGTPINKVHISLKDRAVM